MNRYTFRVSKQKKFLQVCVLSNDRWNNWKSNFHTIQMRGRPKNIFPKHVSQKTYHIIRQVSLNFFCFEPHFTFLRIIIASHFVSPHRMQECVFFNVDMLLSISTWCYKCKEKEEVVVHKMYFIFVENDLGCSTHIISTTHFKKVSVSLNVQNKSLFIPIQPNVP